MLVFGPFRAKPNQLPTAKNTPSSTTPGHLLRKDDHPTMAGSCGFQGGKVFSKKTAIRWHAVPGWQLGDVIFLSSTHSDHQDTRIYCIGGIQGYRDNASLSTACRGLKKQHFSSLCSNSCSSIFLFAAGKMTNDPSTPINHTLFLANTHPLAIRLVQSWNSGCFFFGLHLHTFVAFRFSACGPSNGVFLRGVKGVEPQLLNSSAKLVDNADPWCGKRTFLHSWFYVSNILEHQANLANKESLKLSSANVINAAFWIAVVILRPWKNY